MAGHLTKRILFAVVAIPATMGVLWLGGWWLAAAIAILGILGAREVYDLAQRQSIEPLRVLGYVGALPIAFYHVGPPASYAWIVTFAPLLFTVWLLLLLVIAMRRGPERRPLASVSVTCFGTFYTVLPLTFLLPIRHAMDMQDSVMRPIPIAPQFALVLLPLVLTWICDTFAYMVGSKVGGAKMAPVLSPNKTWSGAIGGAIAAVVSAALLGQVLNRLGWSFALWQMVMLGAVVGVVAQVGDVAESLLKREAGVKDSSNLLPGHGGVLDRLDSLYFVIPASAAVFALYGVI